MYAFLRYDPRSGQRWLVAANLHRAVAFESVQIRIPEETLYWLRVPSAAMLLFTDRLDSGVALTANTAELPTHGIILPRIPALSAGWKGSLEALLADENKDKPRGNAGLAPSSAPPPAWPGFCALRVASVQRECVDVLSFTLEAVDRRPLPAPRARSMARTARPRSASASGTRPRIAGW